MNYCERCAKREGWPHYFWIPRALGTCEVCGERELLFRNPNLGNWKKE